MIQIYPLLPDFYVHLHCHMLKSINVALAYILQIVITHNQRYLSVQPVKYFSPFGRTAKTKITQVKHDIILSDCIIPIGYDSFIHHLHILERSVTETNDIPMIKMGVRCKEHSTQIQCVYCSELWLLLVTCSFCFFASLMFILFQKRCKINK